MEFHHEELPAPKKWKTAASAGKVMHTVFCNVKGVVHSEFMARGTTINSVK
jgi:hypothetical protein